MTEAGKKLDLAKEVEKASMAELATVQEKLHDAELAGAEARDALAALVLNEV